MGTDVDELDLESVLAAARASTGLDDFGDERFTEPLAVLLDAVRTEADLTDAARAEQRGEFVHSLEVRLRAQHWFTRSPEILDEVVEPALVIVGPQRSGTSKLFRLLAADDRWTKLITWQAQNPIPLVEPGSIEPDPRIAEAEAFVERMRWLQPAHEMDAHAPEMEAMIMNFGFMTNSPTRVVPSHQQYCAQADHTSVYDFLHAMLQFIQWQNGGRAGRWVLKSPTHLPTLRELHARYPDTVLVMTHRHPLTSVASMLKLVELGTQANARHVDRARIRDFWVGILQLNMERFLEFREHDSTTRWVDVPYQELRDQSLESVERIYAACGVEMSDQTRATVEHWEQNNPEHKQGAFSYRLEDYGMTEDDVEREFAPYISAFGHLF